MVEVEEAWKEHIRGEFLYRVVAKRFADSIREEGFQPYKNPYTKYEEDIKKFSEILNNLFEKGFVMMRWWGEPVSQVKVMKTTLKDLESNYIDFTPQQDIEYYLELKGGALPQTIFIYTEELLMKRPKLSESEWALVRKLNKWSKPLCDDENLVFAVKADSVYLESAHFKPFGEEYVESPFGSLENFKKAVEKNGLEFYLQYLDGEKKFYLRTKEAIPPEEVEEL